MEEIVHATDSLSDGLLFFLSLSFTTKMLLVRAARERMTQPFGYQSSESDQACGIDPLMWMLLNFND